MVPGVLIEHSHLIIAFEQLMMSMLTVDIDQQTRWLDTVKWDQNGLVPVIAQDDSSNQVLMMQYGFALLSNTSDEARLGWGLMDAIGKVSAPAGYSPLIKDSPGEEKYHVYESLESNAVNEWWSDERLALLESEAFSTVGDKFMSSLKLGKKMTGTAYGDGNYDPTLLTAALIGTMPVPELKHHMEKKKASGDDRVSVKVTKRHQRVLRSYLTFIFTRKLEKLLENLFNGLKVHFGSFQLWTKASDGGIRYKREETEADDESKFIGWQQFFDENAYTATMEVEKRYYAIGPDSCVLTLYDGQLQALQNSIDGLLTIEKFQRGVLKQLEDLDFEIAQDGDGILDDNAGKDSAMEDAVNGGSKKDSKKSDAKGVSKRKDEGKKDGKASPSKSRRRNRKSRNSSNTVVGTNPENRPPATKLHIGNLAYSTTPPELYDFFASRYGRDNVLECHIPTERDTRKSRGFGFVTLPENVARQILSSGKFELDGRLLKIAESNSAGSNRGGRFPQGPPPMSGDRCATCGYRPKYCECAVPNFPGQPMGRGPMDGPGFGRDYDCMSVIS